MVHIIWAVLHGPKFWFSQDFPWTMDDKCGKTNLDDSDFGDIVMLMMDVGDIFGMLVLV